LAQKGGASRFTVHGGNKAKVFKGCAGFVDNQQKEQVLLLKRPFLIGLLANNSAKKALH
jgi:hypothetical protein